MVYKNLIGGSVTDKISIYNCDCMELLKQTPDNYYSLSICDPPYGIGMDGGNVGYKGFNDFEKKDWDKSAPNVEYFVELKRVSVNQIIWGGNYFGLPSTRGFIIWDKGEGFKGRTYASCEFAWSSFDCSAKTFYQRPQGDNRIHPTQKPVKLYRWLLKNYAKEGDKILDTHGGSMSSAIACHQMGFDLTLCELDKDYYEAGVKRFKEQTMQQSLFNPHQ